MNSNKTKMKKKEFRSEGGGFFNKYHGSRQSVCVCVLHLLVGELVSTGAAGLLVEVLLCIQQLLGSVLVLVDAGVLGPHAAAHRPPQL